MHLSDTTVKELLSSAHKIKDDTLAELMQSASRHKKSLQDVLLERKLVSEKELTKLYAESVKTEFVELGNTKIDPQLLNEIPEHIARQYQAVLFHKDKSGYKLAMADPDDLQAIDVLDKMLGKKAKIYIAATSDIAHVLDQYGGNLDTEITEVIPETESEKEEEEVSAKEVAEDSPVAKTVNLVIEYAIKSEASDIHIEPREEFVQIRYRIDGLLREVNTLPRKMLPALVSRIKIMANLKIDEHRKPQDGRFKIVDAGRTLAIRVSTLPVMDGEKVVMRLLDESSRALTLEELGFNSSALERMQRAMSQPHGMILVTGPTGAGKSTTLYSMLSTLNTPLVNISTVEDPVEYRILGVNQTQVNPVAGMTFASGLRALLRQDPNIIMVGEIRDGETADLAIQAALTGHLVLSTLHTNNAATTLPRLLDMGAEAFLIASTVRAVVGQRLVRKLCPTCRVSYRPDSNEVEQFKTTFQLEQALRQIKEELAKMAHRPKMVATDNDAEDTNKPIAINPADLTSGHLALWKAGAGCEDCGGSGYRGRMGIYETLEVDEEVSKLIVGNATSDDIQVVAVKNGMITMQQDGLIKALQGLTTIEEILRVTRE